MFSSVKKWILVALVIAAIGAYYEFQNRGLQTKVKLLEANSAVMTNALKESNEAFSALKQEHEKVRKLYEEVVAEFKKVDNSSNFIKDKIDNLEITKETEIDVNLIFEQIVRCAELSTGSPLTEKEKEAKNAEEFNSRCPWFYDPSSVR